MNHVSPETLMSIWLHVRLLRSTISLGRRIVSKRRWVSLYGSQTVYQVNPKVG